MIDVPGGTTRYASADWRQGEFIDMRQYRNMSEAWKDERRIEESMLVRPSPTGNAICRVFVPEDAAFIAERLNVATWLEHLVRDYLSDRITRDEFERAWKLNFSSEDTARACP